MAEPTPLEKAAAWVLAHPRRDINKPLIPEIRRRFDLSPKQAIDAIKLAASVNRDIPEQNIPSTDRDGGADASS